MLNEEVVKKENSIEIHFCVPFEKLNVQQMSDKTSEMLIRLLFADRNFELPADKKPFLFQVIEKRLEHVFTFRIKDQRLILFLCVLSESPGNAVMYLTYLQYWCKKKNIKEIDLDMFCERIFPNGFPLEKDMIILWDKVKVRRTLRTHSDNLLDYNQAMKSIQFDVEELVSGLKL